MRGAGRIGFVLSAQDVKRDILVPHYYDPTITARLEELEETHTLWSIADLLSSRHLDIRQGNYIGKIHYGSGSYPYIRTSDIANWELRGSPKHGVSEAVYEQWAKRQDVRAGDVLLVHEGTYLIGTSAYVTTSDHRFLFQHHLAKLRCMPTSPVDGPLLAALLTAPVVQAQIRARQFTADIIDSIVGRLPEVKLPIPRDEGVREELSATVRSTYETRAKDRVSLSRFFAHLEPTLISEEFAGSDGGISEGSFGDVLGGWARSRSFKVRDEDVKSDILLPRYYDPAPLRALDKLKSRCDLVTIGELVSEGTLSIATGHEVGKLAYGTGSVPFVRTSDLASWELKHDPKQLVSQAVFDLYRKRQSVEPDDILLVRDGTYLIGTTAIVSSDDLPMLYSGGMYRIRVTDRVRLDPHLLLALLNSHTVRQQMRNAQFTRDVIDTLGHRLLEIVLPIPRNGAFRERIARKVRFHVQRRLEMRKRLAALGPAIESAS